jgi:uncharacterized DUF497 family protein
VTWSIEFDWDDSNLEHIAEHSVTREEAEFVLNGSTLDVEFQDWYGEERFVEVGVTAHGRYLTIVTTWRRGRLRVVTAFDASKELVEEYLGTR